MVQSRPQQAPAGFRFLDLPTELRLNIYDLALGGRTLHVGDPCSADGSQRIRPCKALKHDDAVRSQDVKDLHDLFVYRHLKCKTSEDDNGAFGRHGLALLSVCRQIYNEAASIPFSENTFTFSSPTQMQRLVASLTQEQQHAISNVTLLSTGGARNWVKDPETKDQPPRGLFPGLKNLALYLELCPLDLGGGLRRRGSVPPSYAGNLANAAQQDLHHASNLEGAFAGIVGLKSAALNRLEVRVVDTSEMKNYQHQQLRPLDAEMVEGWRQGLRRSMLGAGT
ncbi:hypothetical protein KC343_g5958 [Hortaea werneckii]|uniref:DUF7730 domain-containing protein n=1 Tax=Hortaea werneckii TaxID=91943 RepID=A0A3M7E1I5_HORWE|nr:hypothetical protein KC352_g18482 [Hortaea werneckii]KAI7565764.1 hypothetical protein KC317_g6142 [Hortaea werneckii]KAI7615335.1 hypothetical protein KC346_g6506 [Hortaea werneckii]KAI7620150.1 hypothetical protein KC319_g18777 [Hortaea werneckii]KAI7627545.1 hypothetical protein KC343_g5958 [Hortaea werneckii]